MQTLGEFIKENNIKAGDKIICVDMSDPIEILFITKINALIKNCLNVELVWGLHGNIGDWQLYKEPKKKVTKYLWAMRYIGDNECKYSGWDTHSIFFELEAHVKKAVDSDLYEFKRLDWSATEFDVEE